MGRDICISGFATLTRDWVNEQPDDVEIWAMNEAHIFLQRKATRWFQLHPKHWRATPVGMKAYLTIGHCKTCEWAENGKSDEADQVKMVRDRAQAHAARNESHDVEFGTVRVRKNGYGRAPYHLAWLKRLDIPVYQMKIDKRIPRSTQYPYKEIVERYGYPWVDGKKRPYLTSSAAFMLALAIYEHDNGDTVDSIRLAGIELAIGTEYFHQRPCLEHWLGIAVGKGIEIVPSPYGTSLLNGPIYAVEHQEPLMPELSQGALMVAPKGTATVALMEDEYGEPVGL